MYAVACLHIQSMCSRLTVKLIALHLQGHDLLLLLLYNLLRFLSLGSHLEDRSQLDVHLLREVEPMVEVEPRLEVEPMLEVEPIVLVVEVHGGRNPWKFIYCWRWDNNPMPANCGNCNAGGRQLVVGQPSPYSPRNGEGSEWGGGVVGNAV